MQSGVGGVANAVLAGFAKSDLEGLTFYSEVIQDGALDLIDCGKFVAVSGTSLTPSDDGLRRFKADVERYKKTIVLRPQEISNNPEVARRIGVISMNTAIEVDIYGHVNSTHIMGTRMMNGIGGSGDFTRAAYISIFMTASTAKGGDISSIVPMLPSRALLICVIWLPENALWLSSTTALTRITSPCCWIITTALWKLARTAKLILLIFWKKLCPGMFASTRPAP